MLTWVPGLSLACPPLARVSLACLLLARVAVRSCQCSWRQCCTPSLGRSSSGATARYSTAGATVMLV